MPIKHVNRLGWVFTVVVFVIVVVVVATIVLVFRTTPGLGSSPRVVIIGAGIGGATCAYQLKKEVPGADVTVLEARDRIGGRIKDITFFGQRVNVGASVYSAQQKNIAELVKELNLTVDRFSGGHDDPNIFVWDGAGLSRPAELLRREPAAELLRREPAADSELKRQIREFLAALDANYRAHERATFDTVSDFLKAGRLDAYTRQSADDFFRDTAVTATVQKYAVEPVVRMYFGQGLTSSAMLAMTCLAGDYGDSIRTKGGMSRLVEATINSSGCDLQLNSPVTLVTRTDTGQFEVTYKQGESDVMVPADVVVIAAPFEYTGIKFEGFKTDPSATQPIRQWQRLYYYLCYVAAKSIRPSYFKKDPESLLNPVALYTTSNTTQPWVVIRHLGSSRGYNIYCVSSSEDISRDDLLHDLFDDVREYTAHQWNYVCPLDPPIREESAYQSIVLDDRLYSLNGLESVATQMEISVTGGRNIAKLIASEV